MQRPEVRIIQHQEEEIKPTEISGYEAEQLLKKYGYNNQSFSTIPNELKPQKKELTFEEMLAQEETRLKEEQMRRNSKLNGPKPTTFDPAKGYNAEIKTSTDEESGFGFTVQIVSDMPIPKR